ncbi:MAG: DUF4199 domain-containing protein [Chitinophagaceae bacterium]
MKNIAVRYALIVFAISVVWTLTEHALGFNTTRHDIGQYTRQVPAFIFYGSIVLAIWQLRKSQQNSLRYGQGILLGLNLTMIYASLLTIWYALYAEVINKQFQSSLLAFREAQYAQSGASADNLAEQLRIDTLSSGGSLGSYVLLFAILLLFGLCVSVVAGLALRKRPKLG